MCNNKYCHKLLIFYQGPLKFSSAKKKILLPERTRRTTLSSFANSDELVSDLFKPGRFPDQGRKPWVIINSRSRDLVLFVVFQVQWKPLNVISFLVRLKMITLTE